jgi:hypothetical protein
MAQQERFLTAALSLPEPRVSRLCLTFVRRMPARHWRCWSFRRPIHVAEFLLTSTAEMPQYRRSRQSRWIDA